MNDDVHRIRALRAQFGSRGDEGGLAEGGGGTDRDDVRFVPGLARLDRCRFHRHRALRAIGDVANLGAEQAVEQRVAGGRSGRSPFTTRMQRSPSFAATAAVTRAWFD